MVTHSSGPLKVMQVEICNVEFNADASSLTPANQAQLAIGLIFLSIAGALSIVWIKAAANSLQSNTVVG